MLETVQAFMQHPDFWAYLSIPFVAGAIGWFTNWVAIQMTFYPVKFWGIPPFLGWQGIIPRKGKKMAGIVVDNTLARISTMREIFAEFEPHKIAHHIVKVADARLEELTDDIMNERNAVLWENLPNIIKSRVYDRTRRALPQMMDALLEDMQENIEELVDPKEVIIERLSSDTDLLNRVFQECGAAEFKFIINSGFWFGALFGIAQAVVWYYYPIWWTLPVAGLFVGIATNWLALNLIFRPLNPIKFGPWIIHGLFLKRQNAVAEVFCRIVTRDVLTIGHLMRAIFKGPKSDRTKAMIKKHLRPIIEGGLLKTMAQLTVGAEGYVGLKQSIEDKTIEMSLATFDDPVFTRERGVMLEKMFRDRMQAMTSEEFQDLLRPAFQEDEWILIAVGGVLGLIAGLVQLVVTFGY